MYPSNFAFYIALGFQTSHIMITMSFSDTLSIAGILISVLFGLWGIYLSLRRAKYPASLTFVREQTVALLDDFATRIPNLAVLYKDTPVDKSVVLISGYLVNDGNVDITPQMTERPLTCGLPIGCSWLEFKLTGAAEALSATGGIKSPESLELNFGLFRRDEAFSFQALALVDAEYAKKKPTALAEALRWSHRIAGLGAIRSVTLPEPETKSKKVQWTRKGTFMLMAILYLFFGLSVATGLGPLGRVPSIAYEHIENGKTSTIRLTPNRDGTTTVTNLATGEDQKVSLTEYTNGTTLKPIYQERREPEKIMTLMGVITVLMSGFIICFAFAKDYKRYRLRRLVAIAAKET
jgi:hypothetical protein